jgi:ATP-dependent phosphoenolpyruvate carboxykinase
MEKKMNTQLNASSQTISNQIDSNELRELSCLEQNEVGGGGSICYKNSAESGKSNDDRFVVKEIPGGYDVTYQQYNKGTSRYKNKNYPGLPRQYRSAEEAIFYCEGKGYKSFTYF